MTPIAPGSKRPRSTGMRHWGQQWAHWLQDWWRLARFAAIILVLALSPSSYRPPHRRALALHSYRNTAPMLPGFSLLCALITVVITRIVLVTAQSYGLTPYALQVVIRILVLELIPITAALFVALRCTIPDGADLAALQARGGLTALQRSGQAPLQTVVLPRVVAGLFAGVALAGLSSVVVLVVAYLVGYGFTVSGLPAYTRLFGQVFEPVVSLIFVFKTVLFSMAVALIPMASALYGIRGLGGKALRSSREMHALVRMFAVLLIIEVASLVGNYY